MLIPVKESDVGAVVELLNRAYRGTGPAASWNTESVYIAGDRTSEALVRADLSNPDGALLKWIDGEAGTMSGCVWLESQGDGNWYLGLFAADPARQNAGLGRTILSAAEDWVKAKGGRTVRMTVVNVRDTLIAWYVRRGYRLTDETEPFPYDDNRFGTPLRSDLSFVVLVKDLDA